MAVAAAARTLVQVDDGDRVGDDALASSPVPCSPVRWRWQRQQWTLVHVNSSITNPDMDCIKLEIATFKFGDQKTDW